jgi:beta-glucosidase
MMCAAQHWQGPAEESILDTFGGDAKFLWGAATASFQIEGAWDRDGRQPSIWDDFIHARVPGRIYHNQTADIADDFYDLWEEDVDRVVDYNFNSFRMSISWPRVFPRGEDGIHRGNPKGVKFYKKVLARLISRGVTPFVTMFHWDLPNDYDWLDDRVVAAFADYADFLFQTFPEVKYWVTINEPTSICMNAYGWGKFAPGVVSKYKPLLCSHNLLRAHARAVKIYRQRYQRASGGQISFIVCGDYTFPMNASRATDVTAGELALELMIGTYMDPIWLTGDYPQSLKALAAPHLPNFTSDEKASLKGSADFYALNLYGGMYAHGPSEFSHDLTTTSFLDLHVGSTGLQGYAVSARDTFGAPIGQQPASPWLHVVPKAIRFMLEWVNQRYQPPAIIITEQGCDVPGENELPLAQALNDTFRLNYYRDYLQQVAAAVRESSVPVRGYFAWSLLDNFEWADGYHFRFGITYVNYTSQQRFAKSSAKWFQVLLGRMRSMNILIQ